MTKPSFGKLRVAEAHFGASGKGTPYISDGDSARVLFFFNLSGAYNGNERHQEAKDDAAYIANAVNNHNALVAALEWIVAIADKNYEQDDTLRSQGARTLIRISDKAQEALKLVKEG